MRAAGSTCDKIKQPLHIQTADDAVYRDCWSERLLLHSWKLSRSQKSGFSGCHALTRHVQMKTGLVPVTLNDRVFDTRTYWGVLPKNEHTHLSSEMPLIYLLDHKCLQRIQHPPGNDVAAPHLSWPNFDGSQVKSMKTHVVFRSSTFDSGRSKTAFV